MWKYRRRIFNLKKLAGFLPTPPGIIEQMLVFAEVGPKDLIYDLGCGDGRILITAAKKFGAKGIGVDIDPKLVQEAKDNAEKEGIGCLVSFIEQDAMAINVSEATIVFLYLPASSVYKLKPKLEKELNPDTLLVSHGDSYFKNCSPFKTKIVTDSKGFIYTLYLWRVKDIKRGSRSQINNKLNKELAVSN